MEKTYNDRSPFKINPNSTFVAVILSGRCTHSRTHVGHTLYLDQVVWPHLWPGSSQEEEGPEME